MSTIQQPDISPLRQLVRITIHLAGEPEFSFSTHGDGSPDSQITVASGACLIFLKDRFAARTYAAAWLTRNAQLLADRLPAERRLADNTDHAVDPPTIAISAIGRDTPFVRPGPGGLHATIGRVTWICHDQAAFAGQQRIWRTVLALSEIVLPDNDWSRLSRR